MIAAGVFALVMSCAAGSSERPDMHLCSGSGEVAEATTVLPGSAPEGGGVEFRVDRPLSANVFRYETLNTGSRLLVQFMGGGVVAFDEATASLIDTSAGIAEIAELLRCKIHPHSVVKQLESVGRPSWRWRVIVDARWDTAMYEHQFVRADRHQVVLDGVIRSAAGAAIEVQMSVAAKPFAELVLTEEFEQARNGSSEPPSVGAASGSEWLSLEYRFTGNCASDVRLIFPRVIAMGHVFSNAIISRYETQSGDVSPIAGIEWIAIEAKGDGVFGIAMPFN